jgi:hypothetical protein
MRENTVNLNALQPYYGCKGVAGVPMISIDYIAGLRPCV